MSASCGNGIGVMDTFPPAEKVQQVLRIAAQGEVGHAAEAFVIQIAIDPIDFAAGGLLDDAERAACGIGGGLVDDAEGHGRAASSSDWNWRASPPCDEEAVGIVALGQGDQASSDASFPETFVRGTALPVGRCRWGRHQRPDRRFGEPSHSCRNWRALRWVPSEQVTL